MSLPLPPRSLIRTDAATAQYVYEQLTSVIVGHPQATTTYRFYEELDFWLGPWGQNGYPIAYGKFYNVLFTTNAKLDGNAQARQWVWHTTIFLQEALRDFAVSTVRDGSIRTLTEARLRQAAFDSHPSAYDRGGLAMVALTAPEMIPVIATIPAAEFLPTADNFGPTVKQVFITLGLIGPEMVGNSLAALAGPAHTGLFARAAQQDQRRFMNELNLSRQLGNIRIQIDQGNLDNIPWLDAIISRLNATQFPDQGFARMAGEIVEAAQRRRQLLVSNYSQSLRQSPEVRRRIEQAFPNLLRPGPI
jgi:hypothetical protein